MVTLLVGVKTDPVLQYFGNQPFVRRNRHFLFLNTMRIGKDIMLTQEGWELPCGGWLSHVDVGAVYNRMLSFSQEPMMGYLNWLLDDCYPNVVNRPKDTMTNFSKIWQLDQASQLGFVVPDTYVYANRRVETAKDGYIYKSISAKRSIVEHVSDNAQRVVHEPVIFQPDKGRRNIRVHVFEDMCFAQEIRSVDVDYRYDLSAEAAKVCELPQDIEILCVQMAKKMGLLFSGIDLILSEGQYYFLEINPSPGYAYYEKQMRGVPISQMLYNYLNK